MQLVHGSPGACQKRSKKGRPVQAFGFPGRSRLTFSPRAGKLLEGDLKKALILHAAEWVAELFANRTHFHP